MVDSLAIERDDKSDEVRGVINGDHGGEHEQEGTPYPPHRSVRVNSARPIWRHLGFDLTTLRLFIVAAEEGNLARAAEREGIALSAVSRRISDLEARSGVHFFERHGRGVNLTQAGELLRLRLQEVFGLLEGVAADLKAARTSDKCKIQLHANMFAFSSGLPKWIQQFLIANPNVDMQLEESTDSEVRSAVKSGLADVGVICGDASATDVQQIPWLEFTLVVVVPNGHRLAAKDRLRLQDLAGEPFIRLAGDCSWMPFLREQARLMGKTIIERAHCASFESVRRMVAEGLGISILPIGAVCPPTLSRNLHWRPLAEEWARRSLVICAKKMPQLPPTPSRLVEFMKTINLKHAGSGTKTANQPSLIANM